MFPWYTRWRDRRQLRRHRIDAELWHRAMGGARSTAHLDAKERESLRDMASLFLVRKSIEPAGGIGVTPEMRVRIAGEACVPVLKLGLDLYDAWHSVIVYPDEFIVPRSEQDDAGVVHEGHEVLAGEAWDRGPVIVSWADIEHAPPGENVVIHEMSHKLDLLDGAANGCPPLHRGIDPARWRAVFTDAYAAHAETVEQGGESALDDYAAEDPAEFFSVASEAFFETPARLRRAFPEVYAQLSAYYRQQP
jgi:hypothetical protein